MTIENENTTSNSNTTIVARKNTIHLRRKNGPMFRNFHISKKKDLIANVESKTIVVY